MDWLNKILGRAPADPTAGFEAESATLEELIAENQRLGREQDAIKEQRRVLAALIDRKLQGA